MRMGPGMGRFPLRYVEEILSRARVSRRWRERRKNGHVAVAAVRESLRDGETRPRRQTNLNSEAVRLVDVTLFNVNLSLAS